VGGGSSSEKGTKKEQSGILLPVSCEDSPIHTLPLSLPPSGAAVVARASQGESATDIARDSLTLPPSLPPSLPQVPLLWLVPAVGRVQQI